MKRAKWKNIVSKSSTMMKPIKRKCKGGYPCGTKPGHGGIVGIGGGDGGGVSESVESSFWDMPYVKELLGYNPKDKYAEDEEVTDSDLASDLADKILSLKGKKNIDATAQEIVDQIVDNTPDDEKEDDPNRAGLIRFVKKAHLVYKRQASDGSYEELWVYPIDKTDSGAKTSRAILAGTDIDVLSHQSEDGKQTCELWTVGNAQMLKILGLPN